MSSDGLLFNVLSSINQITKTPFIATMVCGVCAGKTFDIVKMIIFKLFTVHSFCRVIVNRIQSRATRRYGVNWYPPIIHDCLYLRFNTEVIIINVFNIHYTFSVT